MTQMEEKILIAIISGIITFFIGLYVGRKNLRYQNFLSASQEFRNAFSEIKFFLDEVRDNNIFLDKILSDADSTYDIIIKSIGKQQIAFINFSHYFSGREAIRFKNAWEDYANPNHYNQKTSLDWANKITAYRTKNFTFEKEVRELVRNKINKLLSFAPTK